MHQAIGAALPDRCARDRGVVANLEDQKHECDYDGDYGDDLREIGPVRKLETHDAISPERRTMPRAAMKSSSSAAAWIR